MGPQTMLSKEEGRAPAMLALRAALLPAAAAIALGVVILGGVFLPEIRAAIEIWNTSTAYGHCYLVLPMTLYLLWDRREVIAAASPRPELWWVLMGLPIAAAWLLADRLGIMEGRQLMAVAAAQLLFLTVLGWRMYWVLSGPLLYLFFLVPFGAFVTPVLQRFTADFSIVGLNLLGIPNYADNFTIETPAGVFFVAEACAGLRFLIAAVAFGAFYALLNFRRPGRRLAFMLASIAVPIIANGLRALGIVVLGQILGSAEAAAADHIVYGWVFFSIIMLLLVAAGHPFREPIVVPTDVGTPARSVAPWAAATGAVLAVALVGIGPGLAAIIDAQAQPVTIAAAPQWLSPPGCAQPAGVAPAGSVIRFPLQCANQTFEVEIATFPARSTAAALTAERRRVTEELGAEDVSVAPLGGLDADRGVWTVVQTTDPNRLTLYGSWVDGAPVASGLSARIEQARDSVLGGSHVPVLVTITTKLPPRAGSPQRRAVLDEARALIEAQPGFSVEIERLSRLP